MNVLINLIMVIISQSICLSNHHFIHIYSYILYNIYIFIHIFVNETSIKLEKEGCLFENIPKMMKDINIQIQEAERP